MTGAPIDVLYRLTQRDQAFPHWGPVLRHVISAATLASLESTVANWDVSVPPPAGTILFLTRVVVDINIPLTISLLNFELFTKDRVNGLRKVLLFKAEDVIAGGTKHPYNINLDVAVLMDRLFLAGKAEYSGANVSNRFDLYYSGYAVAQGEVGFN